MIEFLKQLFRKKERGLTFVIFDDQEPEPSTSYRFKPASLLYLFYGSLAGVAIIVFVLLKFTPVGGLVFSHTEQELRKQAINIAKEVQALQDSLRARNAQLLQMKHAISTGQDTVFQISKSSTSRAGTTLQKSLEQKAVSGVQFPAVPALSQNEIVFSDQFRSEPVFPTDFPLQGIFTRNFNPRQGHFGIDIATQAGTPFKAIANGAVVSQNWTLNYGWVLHVQHGNGIVTVYKHVKDLSKSVGDIVLKGDILGTAGDMGIMSSGPHLHVEIWKNGVPQNPNSYLIKS